MTPLETIADARRRIEEAKAAQVKFRRENPGFRTVANEIGDAIRKRLDKLDIERDIADRKAQKEAKKAAKQGPRCYVRPEGMPQEYLDICERLIADIEAGATFREACEAHGADMEKIRYMRRLDEQMDNRFRYAIDHNGRPSVGCRRKAAAVLTASATF